MNGNIQFKIDDTFTLLHDMGVLCKLGNNPQPIYFYKNTVNTRCAKSDLVKIQILLKNKKLSFLQKLDDSQETMVAYQTVFHYDNLYRLVMESNKAEWDIVFSACINSITDQNKELDNNSTQVSYEIPSNLLIIYQSLPKEIAKRSDLFSPKVGWLLEHQLSNKQRSQSAVLQNDKTVSQSAGFQCHNEGNLNNKENKLNQKSQIIHYKNLPFLFHKKEYFNYFKQLDTEIIQYMMQSLTYPSYNKGDEMLALAHSNVSLYCAFMSFAKQHVGKLFENGFIQSNKQLICSKLFDLCTLIIQNKNKINNDFPLLSWQNFFKLVFVDLIELCENLQDRLTRNIVLEKFEHYSDMVSIIAKNINVKDKNEYPIDLEKIMVLFANLDKQKTLGNLSQAVFDFQAENEERELSLVLFRIKFDSKEIEAILKENQMYHCQTDKFTINDFIYKPITSKTALKKEGDFMGNCIAGRYNNGKMSSTGTNSYHVHLFYHVETPYLEHEHISLELDMKLNNFTKEKLEQLFLYKTAINRDDITLSVYESQTRFGKRRPDPKILNQIQTDLFEFILSNPVFYWMANDV